MNEDQATDYLIKKVFPLTVIGDAALTLAHVSRAQIEQYGVNSHLDSLVQIMHPLFQLDKSLNRSVQELALSGKADMNSEDTMKRIAFSWTMAMDSWMYAIARDVPNHILVAAMDSVLPNTDLIKEMETRIREGMTGWAEFLLVATSFGHQRPLLVRALMQELAVWLPDLCKEDIRRHKELKAAIKMKVAA